ncbi:unnamed protein product [Polarella glacialis]|uniref:Uncharacterized protein n=1 Tax=Polarella glacialis TaxID=89957 RepID=A0A813H7C7_POLGL|nr:unnamed protein product [Polarella glacialis]
MAAGSDDGGGSFWSTFGGANDAAGMPEATGLEQLLQDPSCSVEAILEEEDVIQEFKGCNERLVMRLCQPDAQKVLMDCITCEPPPNASSSRCFRYPFVTVELMTCGPAVFCQALVSPDNTEAMDLLWSFIGSTPPSQVNPVLAGYFSRTAGSLFQKYPHEVVDYLRRRGTETLLEEFLERLHLRSLAELFARLLCAEDSSQVVFQTTDLVPKLLARWQDQGSGSDAQENITLIVAELLSQKDVLIFIEDLMHQLTEPSTVRRLVDHIFIQQPGGVPAATSLLSTVIIHTHTGRNCTSACASTPTLSPLSPPHMLAEEDDMVNVGIDEPVVNEAASTRSEPRSPPCSPSPTLRGDNSDEWLERRTMSLMRELSGHFPRFRELLDTTLTQSSSLAMPQGSIQPVGSTALEVVNLVSTLARTGSEVILEAVLNNQLLPRCLEVFFRCPWSSLLHNSVRLLFSEVVSCTEGSRPQLLRQLLTEANFAEKLVEEYSAEAEVKASATRQRHSRVGYMGHLFLMSGELRDFGSEQSPEVGKLLASTSGWVDVVLPALDSTLRVLNEQLGGGVPFSDRNLASSGLGDMSPHTDMGTSSTGMEQDFVLDDQPDFEDDDNFDYSGRGRDDEGPAFDVGHASRGDREDFEDSFDPDGLGSVSGNAPAGQEQAWTPGEGMVSAEPEWPPLSPALQEQQPPSQAESPWVASWDASAARTETGWADGFPGSSWPERREMPAMPVGGTHEAQASSGSSSFWDMDASASSQEASAGPSEDAAPQSRVAEAPAFTASFPSSEPSGGGGGVSGFASSTGSSEAPWPPPAAEFFTPQASTLQPETPAPSSATASSGPVGAENLFALLGGGNMPVGPSERLSAASKQPSDASGQQWPLPASSGDASSLTPLAAGGAGPVVHQPDMFPDTSAPLPSAVSSAATPSAGPADAQVGDLSWMADFDPLAGGGGGGASAAVAQSGGPAASHFGSSDLEFLDFQWQPTQGTATTSSSMS